MTLHEGVYLVLLLLGLLAGICSAAGWFYRRQGRDSQSTGLARHTAEFFVRDDKAMPLFYLVVLAVGLAGPFTCLCTVPWFFSRLISTGERDIMAPLLELPFLERLSYILFGPDPLFWLMGAAGIIIVGAWLGVIAFVALQLLLLLIGVDRFTPR